MTATNDAKNPDVRYERTDVVVGPVVKFVVGLAATILVSCLLMWLLLVRLEERQAQADPPPSPLSPAGSRDPLPQTRVERFPRPRLETHPVQAGSESVAREKERLASYGWVDRPGGVVRIPIERAIALTAERGLPARPLPPGTPASQPEPEQKRP